MKRLLLFLLAAAVITGLVLVLGCSDDDDDGPTGPTPGDPNDPQYMMISEVIGEDFLNHDGALLMMSMVLIDSIPPPGKSDIYNPFKVQDSDQLPDTLEWNYALDIENLWHVFTVRAVMIEEIFNGETYDSMIYVYEGIDSLRFYDSEGPILYPDMTMRSMDIRAHVEALTEGSGKEGFIGSDVAYTMNLLGLGDYLISGESSDSLFVHGFSEGDTCDISVVTTQSTTGLRLEPQSFGPVDICPTSGVIFAIAGFDASCYGASGELNMSSDWTVNFAFDFETVTVTYHSGNNIWTKEFDCQGQVITAYPERPEKR